MTEAEWRTCEDASVVFERGAKQTSTRKIRLALCGCLRAPKVWSLLTAPASRHAVEVAEAFADETTSQQELGEARKKANAVARRGWRDMRPCTPAAYLANYVCLQDRNLATFLHLPDGYLKQLRPLADLLRDIFGNPFRPVHFSPAWRTDTAVSLAKQMYDSREFGAMPILADALQDAGCDSDHVLSHCRDASAAHVRGCWVIDLVLNKS